ncbi:MAG: 2-succinyl-5-enolpyruvyl-6-hydroxy-3-cyclohexene-1-carboxylic-acid synthase [Myxococcota bacterium]
MATAVANPVARAANRNHAYAAALFEELVRTGVTHACVCPGSRSTPLAAAAAHARGLRVWSHVDERSAAFFALGLAKAERAPVALVCTSGTAAANFLPAVVEASQTGVPLVVLTADRPIELRDWGAAQTIDQVRLFGPYARWYAEEPAPEPGGAALRRARALACRAVAVATGQPPGPVHLNLPFREPLEPTRVADDLPDSDPVALDGRAPAAYLRVESARPLPPAALVERLAEAIARTPNGVIVSGPHDAEPGFCDAVARLARDARWPILAEPTSQLRCGPHVKSAPLVAAHDPLLRDGRFAAENAPALVLRLGAPLTSRPIARWLDRHSAHESWIADPDGRFADPTRSASELLRFDPTLICDALADALARRPARPESDWLARFLEADRAARAALDSALAADPALSEPRLVIELARALPDGAALFVSNSMPVRDLDSFLPPSEKRLRVLCNRGANGIDGIVSSALGASAALPGPLALLTGDLAFLHDLGGLLAAKRHGLDATIVVVNNDGGGIFRFLPVASHRDAVDFDALFTTPHGLDLARAAALFDARYTRARDWADVRHALEAGFADGGLHVLEVRVDADANVAHHAALWAAVSAALARGTPPA